MIDESLLAKVSSLSPADRPELIGVAWDTLSPDDLPVTLCGASAARCSIG
jgi:hypothetical protein